MRSLLSVALLFLVLTIVPGQDAKPAGNLGFAVPEGFEVSLFADDSLASDIFSLTIDAKGRVVVASKGYVKILEDTDGDGKADRAIKFADIPKSGAHGMYFDGPNLICDGDQGIRCLYDTDGDDKADKISPVWFPTKNDGEHAANGIVKGPDGWYYLITGNDAGITALHTEGPGSPVKNPNSGCLVRFSPDGKVRHVLADGFRNPYDLAFNQFGQMFTVDADGERVHQMPYYAPTRLYDVAIGMHHGWLTSGWMKSWSRPPYFFDAVERLVEIGRGSPTGVICYRHRAFPERYRHGIFSLCWTFGRVYFFPLERSGSTYKSKMEIFMRTTGDVGFAPTDMAVGPDGDLFIAIGGRGTRGGVFRVHYKGAKPPPAGNGDALRTVLAADEPLSSWSRAKWVPAAQKLGKDAFLKAVDNGKLPLEERIRAVEILTELYGGVPVDTAVHLQKAHKPPELAARIIWSIGRTQDSGESTELLVRATKETDAKVARAAWEALLELRTPLAKDTDPDWNRGITNADRRVRAAAIKVANTAGQLSILGWNDDPRKNLAEFWGRIGPGKNPAKFLSLQQLHYQFTRSNLALQKEPAIRLEMVRLMQIALGDVDVEEGPEKIFVGYVARGRAKVDAALRANVAREVSVWFSSDSTPLNLEAARLLAMLEEDVPGLLEKIASALKESSPPDHDIHYLMCLARIPGKRTAEVTQRTAHLLNGIQIKLAKMGAKPTDHVPTILEAMFERLMQHDPNLAKAVVDDPSFGIAEHTLYANKLPKEHKQAAARKLLASLAKLDEDQARAAWSPELVRLVATMPEKEALPILRGHFKDPRLTDSIALYLAEKRVAEDRPRLVEALGSTQAGVVTAAADALVALTDKARKPAALEIGHAVRALRRLETQKADQATRQAVVRLLVHWTGQNCNQSAAKVDLAPPWVDWFTKAHPKEASTLPGLGSADFATWKKRLDKIDFDKGDVKKGEIVFQKKNCFRCHGDARRLGPDLTGAAQRFSRDDLFVAIFDPSKDIAPAYQPTTIITTSGKVYTGMPIYSSPALFLLQTTPDTTVRIPSEEMQIVQPGTVSFMPAGLIDDLRDDDLAHLYAYLKTLRKK